VLSFALSSDAIDFTTTHPTLTPTSIGARVGVRFVERVPVDTMSFSSIDRWNAESAQTIDPGRYRLKVGRVNAAWCMAQMIDIETIGNRSDRPDISEAVCMGKAPSDVELTVTTRVAAARPEPMVRGFPDFFPKTFMRVSATAGIVPTADSTATFVAPARYRPVIPNAINGERLTAPLAAKVGRHRGPISRGEVAPFGLNHRAGSRSLLYERGR